MITLLVALYTPVMAMWHDIVKQRKSRNIQSG